MAPADQSARSQAPAAGPDVAKGLTERFRQLRDSGLAVDQAEQESQLSG